MPDVSSCGKHIGMILLEWFTVHVCVFDQQLLVLKQNSPVCFWPPNRRQPGFDECRCRFVPTKMHLMAAQHTDDANRESSQAVMNSWLITNKQTNAKQLSDTHPPPMLILSSSSPSSALLKSFSDTSEWWTPSSRWPLSPGPLTLVHVDETETDEDICARVCVSGRTGGGHQFWC